jgi:hypothetical protein
MIYYYVDISWDPVPEYLDFFPTIHAKVLELRIFEYNIYNSPVTMDLVAVVNKDETSIRLYTDYRGEHYYYLYAITAIGSVSYGSVIRKYTISEVRGLKETWGIEIGPWDFSEQKNKWGYLNNPRWINPSGAEVNYDGVETTEPQIWTLPDKNIVQSKGSSISHSPCGHWHKVVI